MELAIGKADFARALSSVVKAVETRNTMPILSSVRLATAPDGLHITATDLDVIVTDIARADIATQGAVCVDAKLLSAIVTKSGGDISLALKDGTLTVKSGRSKFTLQTLPADDFPDFPDAKYDATFDLDIAALFAPVLFAMSQEETRYYLNGVFFRGGEIPVAAATDGHRLARNSADSLPEFAGVIVPRKVAGMLPKGACTVSVSESKIRIAQAGMTLTSKLVDGTFPDYERVIPKSNDKLITFNADEMRAAAGRVSVVSSERGRAVRLAFAGGAVTLDVSNPDGGSATDEIAVGYTGEPITIGFNSAYLAELVGQFPAGEVMLALADSGSPAIFTSPSADGLLAVLMPMRT